MNTRRSFVPAGAAALIAPRAAAPGLKSGVEFDVRAFGGVGDAVLIDGLKDQLIEDVLLENVDITLEHWTKYPGALRSVAHHAGCRRFGGARYSGVFQPPRKECNCKGLHRALRPSAGGVLLAGTAGRGRSGSEGRTFPGLAAFPDRQQAIRITP